MIDEQLLSILDCPRCHKPLNLSSDTLVCASCSRVYQVIDGIPILFDKNNLGSDVALAHSKWQEFYKGFDFEKEQRAYEKNNLPYILPYLQTLPKGSWFMEVGSGASFLCFLLAKQGVKVLMVDFDIAILIAAKKYFQAHEVKGYFLCANIQELPVSSNSIDASAGIGVIEHSKNIMISIKELFRVTRQGGFTFQTVPALSVTTLVLNQRYGTIPHVLILKGFFSWFHIKLLGSRHMKYGYEESFSQKFLKCSFKDAGFTNITMGFYDYGQSIARKIFGNLFRPLIRLRPFWDIAFIKAYKSKKDFL